MTAFKVSTFLISVNLIVK